MGVSRVSPFMLATSLFLFFCGHGTLADAIPIACFSSVPDRSLNELLMLTRQMSCFGCTTAKRFVVAIAFPLQSDLGYLSTDNYSSFFPLVVSLCLGYHVASTQELKARNIQHARNLYDRAVTLLPRVDQIWLKFVYLEELLQNIAGARQVFERWMKWEPDDKGS